jgi:ketosteroid isomerase-like protein
MAIEFIGGIKLMATLRSESGARSIVGSSAKGMMRSITVVGPVAYGHSIQKANFTRGNGSKGELVVRVTDVYRKIRGGG